MNGRYISIILLPTFKEEIKGSTEVQEHIRCIDSVCYHMGGPLALGDIEEISNCFYLVCPWHYHKINMTNGGKLYQALNLSKSQPQKAEDITSSSSQALFEWKETKGIQRVHEIEIKHQTYQLKDAEEEVEDGDWIYVRLDGFSTEEKGGFKSDGYAMSQFCGEKCIQGSMEGVKKGGDGTLQQARRSGEMWNRKKP